MHFGAKRLWKNVVILTTTPWPYGAAVCPTSASSTNRNLRAVVVTEADFARDQCHAHLMQFGTDSERVDVITSIAITG